MHCQNKSITQILKKKKKKRCHTVRHVTRTKKSWSNENLNKTVSYKDKTRELGNRK